MSIFTNPSKVLGHFWDWFSDESKVTLAFIKPTLQMLEKDAGHALITAGMAAVAQVATLDISSSDKREQALKIIEGTLLAAGTAFVESEARNVIELAVQALKAKAA